MVKKNSKTVREVEPRPQLVVARASTYDLEALAKFLRKLEQPCPSCRWQDCDWTVQSTDGDLMRADYRDRAARVLDFLELPHA